MRRPLLVGAFATALVVVSWGLWSLLQRGTTQEFHPRVLVVFLIVGAALGGAVLTTGEASLAQVSPRLQVAAVIVMLGGTALFTGWQHRTWADLGDVFMCAIVVCLCWRVPLALYQLGRRPVRRRLRRMRGPHLRVVG